MNAFLWWLFLVILILLISAFVLYFIYDLLQEYIHKPTREPVTLPVLNKYRFEKSDVEDLTSIHGNFQTVIPKVTLVNEVQKPERTFTQHLGRKYSLLPDIHQDARQYNSSYSVQEIMSELQDDKNSARSGRRLSTRSVVTEGMKKNSLASISTGFTLSVDSVDCLDPMHIEVLRSIADVEEDARNVEDDIESFHGCANSLRFYEINEKFIRCSIALSDIFCSSEPERKRKKEVQQFIFDLQNQLKSKN